MRLLASLFGQLEEQATEVHADATLSELDMSHGDLANLLRAALKAQHPGDGVYCWVRDVYDDSVVYELTNRDDVSKLYQRSYSIDDNGAVTLGEPVAVVSVTQYVPVEEAEREGLVERSFTQEQRDAMAKSGEAMSDGGFPIATKGDLKNAVQAYGRAANKPAVKRHIIKRAKALGATDLLPEDWRPATESADAEEITGDLIPLTEKAIAKDGAIRIKVIQAGQGSSGYYPVDVLKRDGPKVFTAGTHMHLDHPSISEESDRPERSVTTLAGTLTSDARWEEHGAAGPGLYADAKVRSDLAPLIEELAPHIGVSIRALGKAGTRELEGKKVRTIEAIEQAKSVDFVTLAGAGGKVLDLIESARGRQRTAQEREVNDVDKAEFEATKTALTEAQTKLTELEQWKATQERREHEAKLLGEARIVVVDTLKTITLPSLTRERLTEQLVANPPVTDGALDTEALVIQVKEAAKTEAEYLASVTGGDRVRGMGAPAPAELDSEAKRKRREANFVRMGMSESAAKIAAAGR